MSCRHDWCLPFKLPGVCHSNYLPSLLLNHCSLSLPLLAFTDILSNSRRLVIIASNSLLGECALIDEIMVGEDKLIRFSGCKSGSACSIILRGASSHLMDEAERSMHDALCVLTGNFSPSLSLLSPPSSCICCMPYLTFHNMI